MVADFDLRVEWLACSDSLSSLREDPAAAAAAGCVTRKDRVFNESSSFIF